MRADCRLGWSCAVLALGLSACADDRYQLVLVYPDEPARARAAGIEVVFSSSTGCDELAKYTGPPDLSCRADAACDPEPRAFGRIAALARIRDQSCQLYLAGCAEQRVDLWSSATIRIALEPIHGSGCAVDERCNSGLCQPGTTLIDAAVGDHGSSDARQQDAAPADSGPLDASASDAIAVERTVDGGPDTDFIPSNIDRSVLPAASADLLIDADQHLDTDAVTLGGTAIDRAHWTVVTPSVAHAPPILVLRYGAFGIAAGRLLRVRGTRALAVMADTIQVDGVIDVSAHDVVADQTSIGGPGGFNGGAQGQPGAGPCGGEPGAGDYGYWSDGWRIAAHGGGGGGHGGVGAAGGTASDRFWTALGGGAGGAACGDKTLVPLVGGSGGAGEADIPDVPSQGRAPGPGGGGGGAVQLVADTRLTINSGGVIDAAGGGGGMTGNSGGAGGGAGGAILLESPEVILAANARIVANGGGGSGGDCL